MKLSHCGTEHRMYSWEVANIRRLSIFGLLGASLPKWQMEGKGGNALATLPLSFHFPNPVHSIVAFFFLLEQTTGGWDIRVGSTG